MNDNELLTDEQVDFLFICHEDAPDPIVAKSIVNYIAVLDAKADNAKNATTVPFGPLTLRNYLLEWINDERRKRVETVRDLQQKRIGENEMHDYVVELIEQTQPLPYYDRREFDQSDDEALLERHPVLRRIRHNLHLYTLSTDASNDEWTELYTDELMAEYSKNEYSDITAEIGWHDGVEELSALDVEIDRLKRIIVKWLIMWAVYLEESRLHEIELERMVARLNNDDSGADTDSTDDE